MISIRTMALAVLLGLGCFACGGSDGEANPYPGVTKWKCYQFGTSSCECQGLTPNSDWLAGGTDVVEVTACPAAAFPVCQSYKNDFDDWVCECRAETWTPEPSSTSVMSADACPPG